MRKWSHHLLVPIRMSQKWLHVMDVLVILSLSLIVLSQSLFSVAQTKASNQLASDSFNRTVSNGWGAANMGGSWSAPGTPATWSVAPGAGSINATANIQDSSVLGSVSVQDVDILAKIVLPRCTGTGTNC